jgi:capsular exopolysaccharide synthesis family protein
LKEIIDSNSQKTTSITKQLSPIYLSLVDRKIGLEIGIERAEEQLKTYEEQIQEIDLKLQNVLVELSENQFEFGKISRNVRSVYDISQEIQRQMIELEVAIAEVAIDENAYETLDVVESGLKVGESTTRGGIEVIDKAYPEKIPVSPRINFISAIAGIIGLAVGLAAAFVLEYFDNTYKIPDNIRSELGVDIIGVIPKSKSEDTLVQSLEPSVIESYNVLASNVDFLRISNGNRAIMLTSSIQAENKSNVVANLGISMSKANNKVLIVDANLRNGLQHSFFNLPPSPGLTDLLKDPPKAIPETIHTTEYSNLYLLPTGFLDTLNPLELLSSDNIPQLIKDLEYSYDVVLFDTSPIFPLVDVLVLAPKLNECILIADLEKTPRNTIIRAKERLDKVDINLLGLICSRGKGQSFDVFYT